MFLPPTAVSRGELPPALLARNVSRHYPTIYLRQYAYWKIRTDPAYAATWQYLFRSLAAPLWDLGCGPGVLGFYLRARGFEGEVHGIDVDCDKIAAATSAARNWPGAFNFSAMDLRSATPPDPSQRGHVCILDVLLYLDTAAQASLLHLAAACLAPGCLLILRTNLEGKGWRYRISRATDRAAHRIRWMTTVPTHYPTAAFLLRTLEREGLEILHSGPLWGRTPFNAHLLVARRTATLD
jgi:trans-aconitate methyltransferase